MSAKFYFCADFFHNGYKICVKEVLSLKCKLYGENLSDFLKNYCKNRNIMVKYMMYADVLVRSMALQQKEFDFYELCCGFFAS